MILNLVKEEQQQAYIEIEKQRDILQNGNIEQVYTLYKSITRDNVKKNLWSIIYKVHDSCACCSCYDLVFVTEIEPENLNHYKCTYVGCE